LAQIMTLGKIYDFALGRMVGKIETCTTTRAYTDSATESKLNGMMARVPVPEPHSSVQTSCTSNFALGRMVGKIETGNHTFGAVYMLKTHWTKC
jgi:hypothetical protein